MNSPIHSFSHAEAMLLCSNTSGSVRACPECGDLELSFGNVVIGLAHSDIPIFLRRVLELQAAKPDQSVMVLYLNDTGLGFRIEREQLPELRELLESAQSYGAGALMGAICGSDQAPSTIVH